MTQKIKKYILSQVANKNLPLEEAKELLLDLGNTNEAEGMDVAVIGMAGRFPKAANLDEFWKLLKNGENCIGGVPEERKKDIYNILKNKGFTEFIYGRTFEEEEIPSVFTNAGYLDEIDKFDCEFFNIPPNEAVHMDPLHRIALEIAWETIEDAGYGGDALVGSRTGIYMGKEGTNYSFYKYTSEPNQMQLTGSWESLMISRISYLYDFKGPCMVVDTACSAGLVSIHLAIQALQAGECDQVLAGGINISLTGEFKAEQTVVNMGNVENEDGYVKTFDNNSKGTVWGEGVGMVLLKPLKQAIKDGDHIHAVIKGSAINNDGHSNSLTAPNTDTQKAVILSAWKKARVSPETITYVEAHGTGTLLGDPIEMEGLNQAFQEFTRRKQFCGIGSLKTNMGHMVGASGVASLIKVILSIENKMIPPMINFNTPNPYINFIDGPIFVNDTLMDWVTKDVPRRASLSSFGFSRTNCHMVVEQAPEVRNLDCLQPCYCLTISAKDRDLLKEYISHYIRYINEKPWSLGDLCFTSNIGRGHYEHRVLIIAANKEELHERLNIALSLDSDQSGEIGIYQGVSKIVSHKKEIREYGEISKTEVSKLSQEAAAKLEVYIQNHSRDIKLLEEVCSLYVKGANVDWRILYQGEMRKRLSAPTYPFRRTRCWAKLKISQFTIQKEKVLHPLVEFKRQTSNGELRYETVFGANKQWALTDHHVNNSAVLPGTCYLEMVRFILEHEFNCLGLEFKNIFFLVPLLVEKESKVTISLVPIEASEGFRFAVTSNNQVTHVQGEIYPSDNLREQRTFDLERIKAGSSEQIEYGIDMEESENFIFGPHWNSIRRAWLNGTEALIEMQLPDDYIGELEEFKLHPALLDNAVNYNSQVSGRMFLPFMYKRLKLYAPLSKRIYSHLILRSEKELVGETMTFDIEILDEQGNLLVDIEDYTVKEVKNLSTIGNINTLGNCMRLSWKLKEDKQDSGIGKKIRDIKWAVIATQGTRFEKLEEMIRVNGYRAKPFLLKPVNRGMSDNKTGLGDVLDAILSEIERDGYNGILFVSDYTMEDEDFLDLLHEDENFAIMRSASVDACFQLCKLLLRKRIKAIQYFKVLVRDASYVDGSEATYSPLSAATMGLAKVIGQEYKNLKVDVLDVSGLLDMEVVVKELFNGSGIRAIRKSGLYEQELNPTYVSVGEKLHVDTEGVYVISGGLGRIGLRLAEHLTDKGRLNIVLLGRQHIAPKDQWEILSKGGSEKEKELYNRLLSLDAKSNCLEYKSIDVSNRKDVDQLIDYISENYNKLIGVFHAAGVIGDGFLMLKDDNKYNEVMTPKLNGSLNLLRLVMRFPNCFMFMFSSITALTGGEGQCDYCAANSFIDTLVELVRRRGFNVSAINWPIWDNIGMSKIVDKDESIFTPINPEDAFQWLEHSITERQRLLVPAQLNQHKAAEYRNSMPFQFAASCFLRNDSVTDTSHQTNEVQFKVKVRGTANPTEAQTILTGIVGNLLGLKEIDIYTTFTELGGNSLMSTQYLTSIEKFYPGKVHISDIFSYPTIFDLAEYISGIVQEEHKAEIAATTEEAALNVSEIESYVDLFKEALAGTDMLDEFLDEINHTN